MDEPLRGGWAVPATKAKVKTTKATTKAKVKKTKATTKTKVKKTKISTSTSTRDMVWPQAPDSLELQWFAAHGVEVRPSTIPGAGRGAFACVDIPSNRVIGRYRGRLLTEAEFDARYAGTPGGYVLQVGRDRYVDASDPAFSNWTAMINDVRGAGARANVIFTAAASIKTVRHINPGDEILVSYGKFYW